MNLLIAGGDLRFAWAAHLAARRGISVTTLGLEKSWLALPQADGAAVRGADAVLMPNPWRAAFPGPFAAGTLRLEDILGSMRRDALLILPDDAGAPDDAPAHVCLAADEAYAARNAALTAEGAVHAAMSAVPFAIEGAAALVIGYGRIGRRLAELLRALGAEVSVAARREASRLEARSAGMTACMPEELGEALPRFRLVFNTAPAEVPPRPQLRAIDPGALLMDLASAPFGFSLEAARGLGLHALRENNLPGRYCPASAGGLMLEAALAAAAKGAPHE